MAFQTAFPTSTSWASNNRAALTASCHGGGRHRWGHSVVLATSSLEVKHKQRRVELIRGDLTACAACAAARAVLHGWFEPSDGGGDEDCGGLELAVRIN